MNAFDYLFQEKQEPDRLFVKGAKESLTYGSLYAQSTAFAAFLRKEVGENRQILLISPNSVHFLICYLAILKSGNVCVPLSPEIEQDNLQYIANLCSPALALIHESLSRKFELEPVPVICDILKSDMDKHEYGNETEFDQDRMAEIIFTSGSTGEPKGVMISHRNIMSNTGSIVTYLDLRARDTMLVVLPFYYCYGLSLLHTHLRVGGSIVLNNSFVFLGNIIGDLIKFQCTGFAGVPSHFQILLRKSDSFRTTAFPDLRYVTQAGGKLHNAFILEFIEAFPAVRFFVMYGQTEATARLSYLPPELLPQKIGSCGKGIPDVEIRVVDENRQPVKPGETGEIIARGDNIMQGYYKDVQSTHSAVRDGWLYTGDLATVDEEGFIYLTARKKEIIKVGGRRISPKEIEEVIVKMPEVVDCSIEGIYDEVMGETMKAVVVIKEGKDEVLTPEGIKKFCAERLSAYKIPQLIEIRTKMTMSATGKKIKNSSFEPIPKR